MYVPILVKGVTDLWRHEKVLGVGQAEDVLHNASEGSDCLKLNQLKNRHA